MPHTEIPIQVNAWVDEGIAPLVAALNKFPLIVTLDSCEGYNDFAHIHFAHRAGQTALAEFLHDLSVAVGKDVPADNEYRLQIEWVAGSEEPLATLYVRSDFVEPLAQAIESVALKCDHKRVSSCGNSRKALHS